MRPEKPLPPMSTVPSSTTVRKLGKKKLKLELAKLVRARRRTIDPTKWDSQHLKGAFLDSIIVADGRDDLPPAKKPSPPPASGEQGKSDLSSDEEEDEEGNGSDSEYETTAGRSQTSPGTSSRPHPNTHIEYDVVDTDLDFSQEKLRALSLLDSMFGNVEGNQDWGGKEGLDSDTDTSGLRPAASPLSPRSSLPGGPPEGLDLRVRVEQTQEDSESKKSSTEAHEPALERVSTPGTTKNAATTKAKLKDLFAPQEEQGALPLTKRLSSI